MPKHKLRIPKTLIYILLVGLVLRIALFFYYRQVWWDSAVYIGMGKYLFSKGVNGIWESLRPILLPIILGGFWKLKLNVLLAGRIFNIVISLLSVYLTFRIGKQLFNEKVALLAAFFVAITPTFLFFSTMALSEPVALFFALLGTYFFIEKKYFWTGIFFGLSVLARFPEGIMLLSAALILIIYVCMKKIKLWDFIKQGLLLILGFLLPLIPFLLYNKARYGNFFEPFIEGARVFAINSVTNYTPTQYYWQAALLENVFLYLGIVSVYFILKRKEFAKFFVALSATIFLVYFASQGHKELRFFIIFFPFLYFLAAEGVFYVQNLFKSKRARAVWLVCVIAVASISLIVVAVFSIGLNRYSYEDSFLEEKEYFGFFKGDEGAILSSSPVAVAFIDNPLTVIYQGPFEDMYTSYFVNNNVSYALINECDLFCPVYEEACPGYRTKFIEELKKSDVLYDKRLHNCEHIIVKK